VWALVAASAVYWGLRVAVRSAAAPAHTQTARPSLAARADLGVVLGADPPPDAVAAAAEVAADARFQLIGVVSPRATQAAREGLALIAVDGKPPKAFRVGAVVDGSTVLQAVAARGATLGPRDGAAVVALTLAPPTPAATGVLPGLGGEQPVPAPAGSRGGRVGSGLAPGGRPLTVPPPPVATTPPPREPTLPQENAQLR